MSHLVDHLIRIVGEEHVITDPQVMASFTTDWSRRFTGAAICVVRPADTDEVAAVVRACGEANTPMLPQGGNTGLVGGSVPAAAGPAPVIISLTRLNWIDRVDDLAGQVSVGAGARLRDVQEAARAAGWQYGVDLGARDTATIGGTVATNAGGIHVVAHGMTRLQVMGAQAVLPDGSVITHMAGLMKDNTGFDLPGLLCGSEGTLAIITALRLRLHRPPGRSSLALVGVPTIDDALALMHRHRGAGNPVLAVEVMDLTSMNLVMRYLDQPWPLEQEHPFVVLLEIADGGDGSGLLFDAESDAVLAVDADQQTRMWKYRDHLGDAYSSLGIIHRLDVSIPLGRMAACLAEIRGIISGIPQVDVLGFFGHIADGNIHVELFGPERDDLTADRAILECVARYGGSISAEHGVGRAKANDLNLVRSPEEIAAMRSLKRAWDPRNLMNPGVLFAE